MANRKWLSRKARFGVTHTTVPAVGTQRRLQALGAAGWPQEQLSEQLGHHHAVQNYLIKTRVLIDTHQQVAELYERLEQEAGPSRSAAVRARKKGWLPPEMWFGVDMDDPNATPHEPDLVHVDDVVVDRLMAGELSIDEANEAEVETAVRQLLADGVSLKDCTALLGCELRVIARYYRRVLRGK